MAGCLACKSCAGQCPVKVNVPEFRSRFLALYHRRYLRPLRDYLIGSLEFTLPVAARIPTLYNRLLSATPVRSWLERRAGLVDSPLLHDLHLAPVLRRCKVETATPALLAALSPAERARSVILIQDAFTRWFDTPVLAALIELATRLGQRVFLAPYRAAGKPLQVHGFLDLFARVARRNARMLAGLADYSVPLVGLDPAMTLLYRQEYRKLPDPPPDFQVLLPQEWLAQVWPENEAFARPRTDIRSDNEAFARPTADTRSENETFANPAAGIPVESSISGNSPVIATVRDTARTYGLLAHCTEKATASASAGLWQIIFARAGLSLRQDAVGCCGMSGTYGHEARNRENSRNIFDLSWAPLLDSTTDVELLATGYSCRSQTSRLRHRTLRHPIQALLEAVSTPGGA
jgi:Fe-S oxidoreductase